MIDYKKYPKLVELLQHMEPGFEPEEVPRFGVEAAREVRSLFAAIDIYERAFESLQRGVETDFTYAKNSLREALAKNHKGHKDGWGDPGAKPPPEEDDDSDA